VRSGKLSTGQDICARGAERVSAVAGAFLLRTVLGGAATGLGTPALAHGLAIGATTVTVTPAASHSSRSE